MQIEICWFRCLVVLLDVWDVSERMVVWWKALYIVHHFCLAIFIISVIHWHYSDRQQAISGSTLIMARFLMYTLWDTTIYTAFSTRKFIVQILPLSSVGSHEKNIQWKTVMYPLVSGCSCLVYCHQFINRNKTQTVFHNYVSLVWSFVLCCFLSHYVRRPIDVHALFPRARMPTYTVIGPMRLSTVSSHGQVVGAQDSHGCGPWSMPQPALRLMQRVVLPWPSGARLH